jgi:hypothetical protein
MTHPHFYHVLYFFTVIGVGYVLYLVGGHGLPWVWRKAKALFTHAHEDVVGLEARVKALEVKLGIVTAPTGPKGA